MIHLTFAFGIRIEHRLFCCTQGYGMFMMEQLVHSPDGTLLTRGPGAYKIPGFGDVPAEFNVSLLRGASNPRAVFSSKAVGEPPLFLAASVFFAAKSAIGEARSGGRAERKHYRVHWNRGGECSIQDLGGEVFVENFK